MDKVLNKINRIGERVRIIKEEKIVKTIMLVCAAGMSTSLLVKKMQKAAESKGIEVEIFAKSASEVDITLKNKNIDVLLLGPQIRYMHKQLEEMLSTKNIPVGTISMQHYGMMDGEKVLDEAIRLIERK